MLDNREHQIISFLEKNGLSSSKEIHEGINASISYATLKRALTQLGTKNYTTAKGNGKSTKYVISSAYSLVRPIDVNKYYENEIDEREIIASFNFRIIPDVLSNHNAITSVELEELSEVQKVHKANVLQLTEAEYKKELERLAIDLSWKSSQIEGNTYSLLETERLIRERETAAGKTKEEAVMLLNHKDALDFIIGTPDFLNPLTVSKIEDIHSILIKELAVERNLRRRRIGISGTNYRPLDNEFQIAEALKDTCELINKKESVFEKALLALVLISYIQPFMDGNKRTARIVSNAILMNYDCCPLSFRTVDSIDYKKAMLLFYEQNNISNIKEIFINQFEFAVNTYF